MKDGLLIIDKPQDFTSFDVVAKVRKAMQTKQVGHTGTLDPLATGVLVVCVGKATKLVQYLTCENKKYEAEMKFGIQTDTGDITGNVIDEREFDLSQENVECVIKAFIGEQKQVPPMYSALKVNGKKLYEYAREGIEIEREARKIIIHSIDNVCLENDVLKFTVACSKGTYIRTLCEDIAKSLGTCGTMSNLRRIQTGEFDIKDAIKIDEISEEKVISMEKLFDKSIDVKNNMKKLLNGEKIPVDLPNGLYNLYADEYVGIGKVESKNLKREIIL